MKQRISESQALRYFNARKHLGLGVNEAGRKAGINPTRISALENKNVDKPTLEYTNFLVSNGINFEYLMERSENMLTKQEQVEVNSSEIADLQKEIADLKLALSEKSKVLEKTDLENERNKKNLDALHILLARERHEAGETLYNYQAHIEQLKEKNIELEKTIYELERSVYLKDHFETPNNTSINL